MSDYAPSVDHRFTNVLHQYAPLFDVQPEGYAIDRRFRDIYYVPEDVRIELHGQTVSWTNSAGPQQIQLQPGITYVLPSGYKVEMVKPSEGMRWRLIGTTAEGTFCHKPCTVSGGGKSEISKPISDAMFTASLIVQNLQSLPGPARSGEAESPAAQPAAIAWIGDPAAYAEPDLHPAIQRMGGKHPEFGPRPGAAHQALPQTRLG